MVISIQDVVYLFSELQSFSIGSSRSSFSKREHVPVQAPLALGNLLSF